MASGASNRRRRQRLVDTRGLWSIAALAVVAVISGGLVIAAFTQAATPPTSTQRLISGTAAAPQETETPKPIAVFLGDSYTAGTGATQENLRWVPLVASAKGWTADNLGRGGTGYVATGGMASCGLEFCPNYQGMIPEAQKVAPDIVVVAGGQNDMALWARDQEATETAIRDTYTALRQAFPDTRLIAVGPSSPTGVSEAFISFSRVVQESAESIGAEFVNMLEPDVIAPEMVLEDGGHVGDTGHRAIADRFLSTITS